MIASNLLNNQNIIIYPRGHCVLLKAQFVAIYLLQDQKPYRLNQDGYKILKYIGKGISFSRLKQQLGIQSRKNEEKLAIFLANLIEKQFLTLKREEKGNLVKKKPKGRPYLSRVFLETTQRCNLKCKHCYIGNLEHHHFSNELTEEVINVIDQAEKMGVIQFDFTGGELFVRKDIRNIMKAAAEASMFSNIFTNAVLIDEETAIFLKNLGNINTVYVSLDDMEADYHDHFRGVRGAYEKTIKALKLLKEHEIHTVINLVINRRNHNRLKEIIKYFWETFQIRCKVAPILYVGRGQCMEEEELSIQEMVESIMQWYDAYEMSTVLENQAGGIFNPVTDCGVGDSMVFIKSDGEVSLCPTLTSNESKEFELGNIRRQSLEEIWYTSENLKRFRNLFCRHLDCSYIHLCRGGCRCRAFLWNHDIRERDPVPCHFFRTVDILKPSIHADNILS